MKRHAQPSALRAPATLPVNREATVPRVPEATCDPLDGDLRSMAGGAIALASAPEVCTVSATGFRGSGFPPGGHSRRLGTDGVVGFPRILPSREAAGHLRRRAAPVCATLGGAQESPGRHKSW